MKIRLCNFSLFFLPMFTALGRLWQSNWEFEASLSFLSKTMLKIHSKHSQRPILMSLWLKEKWPDLDSSSNPIHGYIRSSCANGLPCLSLNLSFISTEVFILKSSPCLFFRFIETQTMETNDCLSMTANPLKLWVKANGILFLSCPSRAFATTTAADDYDRPS